jgi:MFS family permease
MDPRYAPRQWQPHEKPTLPGSPSTPYHSTRRRLQYGAVGVLVALTGGLSNALVSANLPYLQGTFGADAWQMQWLPAAFVMTSMSANLLRVKFRQQYGLRLFTEIFLVLYVAIAFAHLFVHGLGSAIAVRAAHGLCGAALNSLGIYYMIQAFPERHRLKALAIGLGMTQLPIPLARMFSTELLQLGEWRGLYVFELGLALLALAGVLALKLPPSDRIKVFERLDFATFATFATGAAGLAVVLSFGRVLWWTQTPWLGVVLAASIVLLCAAGAIEHGRRNPMINLRWLASGDLARLALSILLIRICLSEQSVGAIAFFQQLGLTNDQLRSLSLVVLAGCVAGIAISALTLRRENLPQQLIVAVAFIAIGAFMDARANSLTRPPQMYLSQFLIGLGSTLFIAPAMLTGMGKVIGQPKNLISFIVLFAMAQSMGSLLGSALLGTVQTVRQKFHANLLAEHVTLLDPQVTARLQAYAAAHARDIVDPAQRQAQALKMLGQAVTREAHVLAYNDVFLLIGGLAIATLAWLLVDLRLQRRREAAGAAPAPAPVVPTVPATATPP